MFAFGDSVMDGARESLEARGIQVFAQESEQIYKVTPVVAQLAAAGQLPEMGVVHLGTNDAFRGTQLNDLMDALNGVDRVVVRSESERAAATDLECLCQPDDHAPVDSLTQTSTSMLAAALRG